MLSQIKEALSNLENKKLKEKYMQIIITMFEKGYFPGLENIPVAKSSVSNIDGENGLLTFRGYPIQELANNCSYEDVCFLLLKGDLPIPQEKKELKKQLLASKGIDSKIKETIISMNDNLHPMYMLSSSVLQLQSNDPKCFDLDQYTVNLNRAIQLIAKLPTIMGVYQTQNPEFAQGKTFDSFAQYILYCFNQELAAKPKWVNILDKLLILHGDHTMNNSTFSVRAVGSSKASIYASISSAINSLSGPLHGGANEKVIKMLTEIGAPENVESYIQEQLKAGEKIMGLGHRVYRTYDPRALYLKEEILPQIFAEDSPEVNSKLENLYNTAQKMEEIALNKFADKKIFPNIDFWSGLVLRAMKIEPKYFTTIFALGRIMGWCAHWVENLEVKNKIFRPNQLYDGFNTRHVLRDQLK
ncbi:citrate synthase [Halobacteroides halobius DSM 5150]|uniref:Citrate synthase n=1 Tax=Halobacteroides halobius (strain ATCC 35273 / DSM 5150 / MD-1) TaxID=748449 RepID=L0KCQ4_HALHC|nr:citrate/2-methylcitrate synthase [Halobacteroides halobius]AGB42174.1 citrate synthase [Halobacteroides halobius DSM 5150]